MPTVNDMTVSVNHPCTKSKVSCAWGFGAMICRLLATARAKLELARHIKLRYLNRARSFGGAALARVKLTNTLQIALWYVDAPAQRSGRDTTAQSEKPAISTKRKLRYIKPEPRQE